MLVCEAMLTDHQKVNRSNKKYKIVSDQQHIFCTLHTCMHHQLIGNVSAKIIHLNLRSFLTKDDLYYIYDYQKTTAAKYRYMLYLDNKGPW